MRQIDVGKVVVKVKFVKGTSKKWSGFTSAREGHVEVDTYGKMAPRILCVNSEYEANEVVRTLLKDNFVNVEGEYFLVSDIKSIKVFYGPCFAEVG